MKGYGDCPHKAAVCLPSIPFNWNCCRLSSQWSGLCHQQRSCHLRNFARFKLSLWYRRPLLFILNRHFNITGTALTWFETYLSNRTNSFCYGDDTTIDYILDCSVPQGRVLGPQQFSAYTSDIPSVFMRHTVRFHLYDNDKQAYASGHVSDVDNIRRRLSECASDIAAWCASRRLQLNSAKTEAIWFGSHANLSKLTTCDLSVTVNNDNISPAHSVHDLGVILDDELNMKQHVNSVAKTCCTQWKQSGLYFRHRTESAISITPTRTTFCWLQWLHQATTQHKVRRTIILVRWTTRMEPTTIVHMFRS